MTERQAEALSRLQADWTQIAIRSDSEAIRGTQMHSDARSIPFQQFSIWIVSACVLALGTILAGAVTLEKKVDVAAKNCAHRTSSE